MARSNREWDELGRSIQSIIDQAIDSQNYQKLNQTIRQTVEQAVDAGAGAVRKAFDNAARPVQQPPVRSAPQNMTPPAEPPQYYGSTGNITARGIIKIVGGSLLGALALLALLSMLFVELIAGSGAMGIPAAVSAGLLAGGIGLIAGGIVNLRFVSRFKAYRKLLGDKTHCTLEKLADSTGKTIRFIRSDVQKMIRARLFRQGHLDREETRLITSDETYHYFEESRLKLEEQKRLEAAELARNAAAPCTPQAQEVLDRGKIFLSEIRRCNDAIPGREISEKIDRMEQIIQRIFSRVRTNPEVIPDLKKLMDYYLPMTVKLLNAYADMDAQSVQGETILSAKQEIEETLDTLNLAFEKLLDSLFLDTAMDVSSDISVLQTLLAQEGLTEDPLSRMKKANP